MGPRSENRGYQESLVASTTRPSLLQWVHGPRTVVIGRNPDDYAGSRELQWVHGPRTVVILSTGAQKAASKVQAHFQLQWVHGPRTVVIGCRSVPAR